MNNTATISRALADKIVYVLNCKKSFTQGGEVWPDTEVLGVLNALRAEMELKQTLLTDEERVAIDFAICSLGRDDYLNERHAEQLQETLSRLMEKLK